MSSPLFSANLFNSLLNASDLKALQKFMSKSNSIESFISRTYVYTSKSLNTRTDLNICIFVLDYLTKLGYLRSSNFKTNFQYNGKTLLNYLPTETYNELLKPNAILLDLPKQEEVVVIEDDSLKVDTFQLEVTGKYYHLMKSASTRNKEFNLTRSDVRKLLERKTCFYTGLPFSTKDGSPYQRTIDRVNSKKGYVKGNVVACSKMANEFKNTLIENGNGLSLDKKVIKRMLTIFLNTLEDKD